MIFKSSAHAKFWSKNIVRLFSFNILNLHIHMLHPNQNEWLCREKLNYLFHCIRCSVTSRSVCWPASRQILHAFVKTKHIFFFLSLTFPPTHPMCGGLSLNQITHMDTHTLCRTPLDYGSARCIDLYLTINNIHKRQTSIPRRNSNPQPQQASGHRPMP